MAGLNIHNTDRIVAELQSLKVGDVIPFWRGAGVSVKKIKPQETLVLAGTLYPDKEGKMDQSVGGTWTFAVSLFEGNASRLVIRSQIANFPPRWLAAPLTHLFLLPIHFLMERKMMLGIRQRAEILENSIEEAS